LGLLDASALADVLEIYGRVNESLLASGHADYTPPKRHPKEYFSRLLQTRQMMGANVGGQTVGFVFLGETSTENPQDGVPGMRLCYNPAHTAVLRNAMVHPAHQGYGLGRKLFAACVDLAVERGYGSIVSGVTAPNVSSWHNLVHAGLRLVQVDSLPPEISPNSSTLAFYFHKHSAPEATRPALFGHFTRVDPLSHPGLVRQMLAQGSAQIGYEKNNGTMLLHFSGEAGRPVI
jgi:GNAT superfamily N-acetyltransferase